MDETFSSDYLTSYGKSVGLQDYQDYVEPGSSSVTLTDFSQEYKYRASGDAQLSAHIVQTLQTNANSNTEEYDYTGTTGSLSISSSLLTESGYAARGSAAWSQTGYSNPAQIKRAWGTRTTDDYNFKGTMGSDGTWSFATATYVDPDPDNPLLDNDVRRSKNIIGTYRESTYDDYSLSASETSNNEIREYAIEKQSEQGEGYYHRFAGLTSDNSMVVYSVGADFQFVKNRDFWRTYSSSYSASGSSLDGYPAGWTSVSWTTYDVTLEDKSVKDGSGQWVHSVGSAPTAVGEAHSYSSYVQKYNQPYSAVYPKDHTAYVYGTKKGELSSNRTRVDASVYYDSATLRRFFQGDSERYERRTNEYSGSGAYDYFNIGDYSISSRESSFSEEGDKQRVESTTSYFDSSSSLNDPTRIKYYFNEKFDNSYEFDNHRQYVESTSDDGRSVSAQESASSSRTLNYDGSNSSFQFSGLWNAGGSGSYFDQEWLATLPNSYSSYVNSEDYHFDFSGSWLLTDSSFVRTPVVIANAVQGGQYYYGDHSGTPIMSTPFPSTNSLTSFYFKNKSDFLNSCQFMEVDGYSAQMFGQAQGDPGYTFTPPNSGVPSLSIFNPQTIFYDFNVLLYVYPSEAQWTALDFGFVGQATIGETSRGVYSSILPDDARALAISQINAEINARYGITEQSAFSLVNTLIDAGKFLWNQLIGNKIHAAIIAYNQWAAGDSLWSAAMAGLQYELDNSYSFQGSVMVVDFLFGDSCRLGLTAYNNLRENGAGLWFSLYAGVGTAIADRVGLVSITNAVTGEDLATGRRLSTGERILEGVSGTFDLVSTATGGLGAVRGAVRATGSCNRLGKYFTNCCFTADVDVWTLVEEKAITATAETAESEPEIIATNEDLSDEPGATVEVANEEQAATVAVLADEGINAVGNPLEYEEVASSEKRFSTIGVAGGAIGGLFVAITLTVAIWDDYRRHKNRAIDAAFAERDFLEEDEIDLPNAAARGISESRATLDDSSPRALASGKKLEKSIPIARKRTADKSFARRRRFAASFGALGVLILVLSLTFGWQTVETKRLVPKTTELAETTKQVVEEPQLAIAESPSNDRIAAPQLVDGTELSSESEIVEEDVASSEVSDIPKNVEIQTTASENQFVLRRQKINEVAIGSRTDGANPQGNDGSDESIFREVEHLIYSFELVREDGSVSKVKLLRPIDWLDLETTRLRDRNSGNELSEIELIADRLISPELQEAALGEMALDVWLDLPEVGCVGWAELVDVDDSFEYREGMGNLVTGTFEHVANELLELTIEGDSKPITCTPNHPFWSVDREDFVEAGELLEGERLLVFNGETKRVVQKLPRPGPETVYNLEVFSEHVYRVAMDGVLVHNACSDEAFAKRLISVLNDPIAESKRTIAILTVMDSQGNIKKIASTSGKGYWSKAQKDLLTNEIIARRVTKKLHAEVRAIVFALRHNYKPLSIVASRPVCPDCVHFIDTVNRYRNLNIEILGSLK